MGMPHVGIRAAREPIESVNAMRLAGSEVDILHVPLPEEGIESEGEIWMPQGAEGVVFCAHGDSADETARVRVIAHGLTARNLGIVLVNSAGYGLHRAVDDLTPFVQPRGLATGVLATAGAVAATLTAIARNTRHRGGIRALALCGGRPDLAGAALRLIGIPTLFLVCAEDLATVEQAAAQMPGSTARRIEIVPLDRHDELARLASQWYGRYFGCNAFQRAASC